MDIDGLVKTTVDFKAVFVHPEEIKPTLIKLNDVLRNYPRVPNVISTKKAYTEFTVLGNLEPGSYVLIKDNSPFVESGFIVDLSIELNYNYFSYADILKKMIPPSLVPHSFETIGDIAHLNLSAEQLPYKVEIGAVIHLKTGLSVVNKTGAINSTFRFYELEVLAGKDDLRTVHCENGAKIYLDLRKVYWSSRLQTERSRILGCIKPGETVCDPFCGAGPQVLPLLQKGAIVYANDLNPDAIACLRKSLDLNKLQSPHLENTDARLHIRSLKGIQIDHFIFNLPEHSLEFVNELSKFSQFRLHCFFFCRSQESPEELVLNKTGYKVSPDCFRMVRMVSPGKAVWKLDIESAQLLL